MIFILLNLMVDLQFLLDLLAALDRVDLYYFLDRLS